MSKISLVDVDGHHFPNLALMKLSAWHKAQGDDVDWYAPLFSHPDVIYASKVFTFTNDFHDYAPNDPEPIKGGTGYDATIKLQDEIENAHPDYSIYPDFKYALGFITRGCIRSCQWCVVPRKEGGIRIAGDIADIAGDRKDVVLMDNNFLASPEEFVREQLEKAQMMNLRIDFNQALDARLVNERNAEWLAKTKWLKYIRFSCDNEYMVPEILNAVSLIRSYGYRMDVFVYVLAIDLNETLERIEKLCKIDKRIVPFCQPYRDFTPGYDSPSELKKLARWCNRAWIRKTVRFSDYKDNY